MSIVSLADLAGYPADLTSEPILHGITSRICLPVNMREGPYAHSDWIGPDGNVHKVNHVHVHIVLLMTHCWLSMLIRDKDCIIHVYAKWCNNFSKHWKTDTLC